MNSPAESAIAHASLLGEYDLPRAGKAELAKAIAPVHELTKKMQPANVNMIATSKNLETRRNASFPDMFAYRFSAKVSVAPQAISGIEEPTTKIELPITGPSLRIVPSYQITSPIISAITNIPI